MDHLIHIKKYILLKFILLLILMVQLISCEITREYKILEGARAGTRIGFIDDDISSPPYLIVPVPGSSVDSDLIIEQNTGEIRTKIQLDRETRDKYTLVAIPTNGENIRVVIYVLDENDNPPIFNKKSIEIEFPENTPRDVKRTLLPARDRDLGIFNTQRYVISNGNINNAFRLSSHRERDGVLYLDLQVNGFLDRETIPYYNLIIDAFDGGVPPLKGSMSVKIKIEDVNDNSPVFNQSKYFATIAENVTIGTRVLQVFATDTDSANNGIVSYSINRRQTDKDYIFNINSSTGVITLNHPLDYELKELHELVIIAKDHGVQSLETTVFVSIRVIDVKDNQLFISLIFLTEDGQSKVLENGTIGEFIARIKIHDNREEYHNNVNITLSGGNGQFKLQTRNNVTYIVISGGLDREIHSNYTLIIHAKLNNDNSLKTTKGFPLEILDVNDNSPKFEQSVYYTSINEVIEPGSFIIKINAVDNDIGNNSLITYSLLQQEEGTGNKETTNNNWFDIDRNTGNIYTKLNVDCEIDPMPKLTVIAHDHGEPVLSSSAQVIIHVFDINDNEPLYEFSFYNVSIIENLQIGECIVNVSASDPDCGINSLVNYTIQEVGSSTNKLLPFKVSPGTGQICVSGPLDFEERNVFEVPVVATDRGGLSSTTLVKIYLQDVNDNIPQFTNFIYNISLREGESPGGSILSVAAIDKDSGNFGKIYYKIMNGNDAGKFRIDSSTGEIFLNHPLTKSTPSHSYHLTISATDGGKLVSKKNAQVFINVLSLMEQPLVFKQARYSFTIPEDSPIGITIGTVQAVVSGGEIVRYTISSGNEHSYFTIDNSGMIKTIANLDHEKHALILLNIQASTDNPPSYRHCQAEIQILDVNDNTPKFEQPVLTIWVPENAQVGTTIYGVYARDLDEGLNGQVRYKLHSGSLQTFRLDSSGGQLILKEPLDFERIKRYTLIIGAEDKGSPPKLAKNLTLHLEVQDVNDNSPKFTQQLPITVSEALPVDSHIAQVQAVDFDTGNNARISYNLTTNQHLFGIIPTTGIIYSKAVLDRETTDSYMIKIIGSDHGTPSLSSTMTLTLKISDENDNSPLFTQKSFQFQIEENNLPGIKFGRVIAKDLDIGENARILYSIQPRVMSFLIEADTGTLIATNLLDREKQELYELQVIATDHGIPPRQSEIIVQVQVKDMNDNHPTAILPEENRLVVREEQPIGTEITRVVAKDPDNGENGTVVFSLIESSGDEGDFLLDSSSGVLKTRVVLNHEKKSFYTIGIRVQDKGIPSLENIYEYRLEVLDLNDNRPSFVRKKFNFKVKENATVGQLVGTVAEDGWDDTTITFMITRGNIQNAFDINKTTGVISISNLLDYEILSSYSLQIKADNSGTGTSNFISAEIIVQDLNDERPKFSQDLVKFSIAENTLIGTQVWNFTAIDLDEGGNGVLHYHISLQVPSEMFRINKLTGALYLISELDYEKQHSCVVVITATDQAINPDERLNSSLTAYIEVEDLNDNLPIIVSGSKVTIYGIQPANSIVHVVIASDADTNEKLNYRIINGNEAGVFTLDSTNGQLKIVNPLNLRSFALNITVNDMVHSVSQILHVSIQHDGSSPPRFVERKYESSIKENSLIGTEVLTVSVTDHGNSTLVYLLPEGMADGKFGIHSTGSIYVDGLIDRESKSEYSLTVYVYDESWMDSTTVSIKIKDLNDHAPDFKDSCEDLTVPENQELGVIHTFKIVDPDLGRNGEVTFTIIAGNSDNLFNVDLHSGKLTSRPLDREKQARHQILVTAQDRGLPVQRTSCNITIFVEDENDSDPQFSKSLYSATIFENVPIGTTVLTVDANDADIGTNAIIKYSLINESNWHFAVDNKTGAIVTAGLLDRENIQEYSFELTATDGGLYDSRFSKSQVKIKIKDINDNRPVWKKNPVQVQIPISTKPGQNVVQLSAFDTDEGINSEIIYSLENSEGKFRIQPQTGVITAVTSLSVEAGRIFQLRVIAKDRGNPSLSSSALAVIQIGEILQSNTLRFQELIYLAKVKENSIFGTHVLQVSALRNDGRRQRIIYTIVSGNEDNNFEIVPSTGHIQVKGQLNREKQADISLVVSAKSDSQAPVYAHVSVNITLIDENDNVPIFNKNSYFASVWEGNNKGTFVTQVTAMDLDEGSNSNIIYHIIDGNQDNAFIIEPAFSGIVKTNIVLDREVQDKYKITIIAMDEGSPQMTGTCLLEVNVIDINDTPPTFPPNSVVTLNENALVGTSVTTVMANDVDTNPVLVYSFSENPNETFSIGKYSGKILLAKPIDFEKDTSKTVKIQVSDSVHTAFTTLTVNILDANDNLPEFEKNIYQVALPDDTKPNSQILKVTATDKDSGRNSIIKYSLQNPKSQKSKNFQNLYIDEHSGIIYTNGSISRHDSPIIELTLIATDSGKPRKYSKATLLVEVRPSDSDLIRFTRENYSVEISEDAKPGTLVQHMNIDYNAKFTKNIHFHFEILSGNENEHFSINSPNGDILLAKPLDRELHDIYTLRLSVSCIKQTTKCTSMTQIIIKVKDVNDNPPILSQKLYELSISESKPVGSQLLQLEVTDMDRNGTPNFDIISGNEPQVFDLNPHSGILYLAKSLDYDTITDYTCIIRVRDLTLWSLSELHVEIKDENDNFPIFPGTYLEYVGENEPIGTTVFVARAIDLDKGIYGKLNYSIIDSAPNKFHIDMNTGVVTTNQMFDYESKNRYYFTLVATDMGGKSSTVSVQIDIDSRDEYAPQFTQKSYRFIVPSNAGPGYVIGRVEANDQDGGLDGRVLYQIHEHNHYFKLNRTTGEISLRQNLNSENGSLILIANSGRSGSKSIKTFAEISVGGPLEHLEMASSSMADWVIVLLATTLLLIFISCTVFIVLHLRQKKQSRSGKTESEYNSAFDTLEYVQSTMQAGSSRPASLYSPQYSDVAGDGGHRANSTGSELSNHSASSGRGSAEDGEEMEDEEIAMINGAQQNSSTREYSDVHEDDTGSAKNAQEYFARLGIRPKIPDQPLSSTTTHHQQQQQWTPTCENFDDVDGIDISNLIYSQIPEDEFSQDTSHRTIMDPYQPSMNGSVSSIIHSEEEAGYNWDYLLDWGPQYQPLAQVFAEIASLKESGNKVLSSGISSRSNNNNNNHNNNHSSSSASEKTIDSSSIIAQQQQQQRERLNIVSNPQTRNIGSKVWPILPRSPISHDNTSGPMSPSFSPALSPLSNRSPSISPLVGVGPSIIRTSQFHNYSEVDLKN